MSIRVIVNGAQGKMGTVSCQAINAAQDMELVAQTGSKDNLADAISQHQPQVVVDFTVPNSVYQNTLTIIDNGACPVVGTTGLDEKQIKDLQQCCSDKQLGGVIAPNFSLAAILMMRATKEISAYLPHAEIIEMHHDQKVDSPSGTALKTAAMMAEHTKNISPPQAEQTARGQTVDGISIHSVRLPGLFAHQMVMFGGEGETLTIRHDSMDRRSMMPGLLLGIRKSLDLDHLVYGLEHLLIQN